MYVCNSVGQKEKKVINLQTTGKFFNEGEMWEASYCNPGLRGTS